LELIVSTPARLVKLDHPTELLSKGRFARMAAEIDLSKPLRPGCDEVYENSYQPFWQSFKYEHIHLFCKKCGRVGHQLVDYAFPPNRPSPQSSVSSSPDVAALQIATDVDMVPVMEGTNRNSTSSLFVDVVMAPVAANAMANDDLPALMPWIHVR